MRKLRIFPALAAVAMLAIPSVASADVPRCAAPVTDPSVATFSVFQPAGEVGQWANVWRHDYTVTVQPTGTFVGTGKVYDQNGAFSFDEDITGSFGGVNNGLVTFTSGRSPFNFVDSYSVENVPTDATSKDAGTISFATSSPAVSWVLEVRVTTPLLTAPTVTDMNHGEYVSSVGGGKIAAQKCAGMPLVSKAPKTP